MIRFSKLPLYVLIVLALCLSFTKSSFAKESEYSLDTAGWRKIEAKYCTIFIGPDVDIKRLNSKIRIWLYGVRLKEGSYYDNMDKIEKELAQKFDKIFIKAEEILDMYPRKISLKSKVFKDQRGLSSEYLKIFNETDRERRISFYVHKFSTIYTSESNIRAGVLAHEMGHAISDHYFLIQAPEKIKEMLAQYVEEHLED